MQYTQYQFGCLTTMVETVQVDIDIEIFNIYIDIGSFNHGRMFRENAGIYTCTTRSMQCQ